MLSALTTSLLPESVGALFDPPLDSRSLHLSLATGSLRLTELKLNADRCTKLLLPPPAAPLRVVDGEVRELSLSVDWKNLLSQPLRCTISGLHLRVAPALVGRPVKRADTEAESSKTTRTATGEVEWNEDDLLRVAVERKLAALEAAAPLQPQDEKGEKAGGSSSSTPTGSSWLKKLVTLVLNSLHLEVTDVKIEVVGEGEAAAAGGMTAAERSHFQSALGHEQRSLMSLASPSTEAEIRAAHSAPVKIGVELKQCMLLQSVKIDRPVAAHSFNSTKEMQLGVAVYCDVEPSSKIGAAPSAKCVVHPTQQAGGVSERKLAEAPEPVHRVEPKDKVAEPTATPRVAEWPLTHIVQPSHDYLVEPMLCEMFLAFNNTIGSKLELQARVLTPLVKVAVHPAQIAAICSLLSSILHHQSAVQREVDRLSTDKFRAPTAGESDLYASLVAKAMRGQKLDSWQQRKQEQLEKVLSLKSLAVVRHEVRARLHEKQLHDEQVQAEAEERKQQWYAEASKSGSQTSEAEQPQPEVGMWQSLSSYFGGLISSGEEGHKTAPSDEQKAPAGGSVQVGGVGKLQSALDEATPFDLDVQIECEAESVDVVLFEGSRKSEHAALLALRLHDAALCVDTDPGGAVDLCAGVRQLNLIDATRPQDRLPSTYFRMVPGAAVSGVGVVKPEKPQTGSPFELLPMEFYRTMPFLLSGSLLPSAKAVAVESELQSKSPGAAAEEAKTAEHLNEIELAVSGVQGQLLLTLATKLGQLPSLVRSCAAPLLALPPSPQPLPASNPELRPQSQSPLDLIAALLPMRFRLNVGGGRMLPYLGEELPAQSAKQPSAHALVRPPAHVGTAAHAPAPGRKHELEPAAGPAGQPPVATGARWCVYL